MYADVFGLKIPGIDDAVLMIRRRVCYASTMPLNLRSKNGLWEGYPLCRLAPV